VYFATIVQTSTLCKSAYPLDIQLDIPLWNCNVPTWGRLFHLNWNDDLHGMGKSFVVVDFMMNDVNGTRTSPN